MKSKAKYVHGRQCGAKLKSCIDVEDHKIFMELYEEKPHSKRIELPELPLPSTYDESFEYKKYYITVDSEYYNDSDKTAIWCCLKEEGTDRLIACGASSWNEANEKLALVYLFNKIEKEIENLAYVNKCIDIMTK